MDLFKEVIPSLTVKKEYILNNESDVKEYVPYVVNKALSFHMDCILYANEMNRLPNVTKKLHYDYLYNSLRRYKRPFVPWMKKEKDDDLAIISKAYNCSASEAKYYQTILTQDQIDGLKKELDTGGLDKKKKKGK